MSDLEKNDNASLSGQEKYLEKGEVEAPAVVVADNRYHFDAADLDQVQRRLKQRHVQMYALSPFHITSVLFFFYFT
jgi:yeast amino acid transporter